MKGQLTLDIMKAARAPMPSMELELIAAMADRSLRLIGISRASLDDLHRKYAPTIARLVTEIRRLLDPSADCGPAIPTQRELDALFQSANATLELYAERSSPKSDLDEIEIDYAGAIMRLVCEVERRRDEQPEDSDAFRRFKDEVLEVLMSAHGVGRDQARFALFGDARWWNDHWHAEKTPQEVAAEIMQTWPRKVIDPEHQQFELPHLKFDEKP